MSTNYVRLEPPYNVQPVRLCLRQHPRWGQDVIVSLTSRGQFICSSYNNCIVRVRFDDGEAARYSANEPDDHSHDTIFTANDARFVTNVKRASRIIIEAEFYRPDTQQMMFDTSHLESR